MQLAIPLIKNRLQDTVGGRLRFVLGGSRRESARSSPSAEDQSGLTSATTESKERGVYAASTFEREEATSKRAEARAPQESAVRN